jgi:hypothetical protein
MLVTLGDELHRGGTRMMIAHDLGQVGDLVKKEDIAASIDGLYPTVADAVGVLDLPAEP